MNDKEIRLAGMIHESLVNGPGIRRVFFSQGCNHNCRGCFNPETHSFEGGKEYNMDDIIRDIKDNPMIKGVTFSGGDPFQQGDKFSYLALKLKENNINIWCYTGYTYEFILDNLNRPGWFNLINNIDVLVDGRFQIDKKEEGLKFKGSSNQRIIDVKESLKSKNIKEMTF
ncbi:MAG: anaerobic ribonucleoside-triphosphate reductase activating protein [Bacillota bacterium]|nr:anaerobic ribonucleoside-triphosphate reductase activating protein [Bacillota bacterium]